MNQQNKQAVRLYRVRKTILDMLADRGYLVSEEERSITFDDFQERYSDESEYISLESLFILKRKRKDPSEQIFVFFAEPDIASGNKIGVKVVKKYFERMKEESVRRAILCTAVGLTSFAKQAINEMKPKEIIEVFEEKDLLVNITKHQSVPKHILLSSDEKKALLERYKLKESQLPRIRVEDPVARYYGLEIGEVVKIIRPSETAGRYVTYRLVC